MSDQIQMLPVTVLPEAYSDFARYLLQKVAASLGITYAQMSAEYEAVNFSRPRHAMQLWQQGVYEDWLREQGFSL